MAKSVGCGMVLSFAALDAQALYAAPSHATCISGGDRQYGVSRVAIRRAGPVARA
jgi:hypothetical protein